MDYEIIADLLKGISHADRLRILSLLKDKEMDVSSIYKKINRKQSVTSQHLNNMKRKGLLKARREGNTVYYTLANSKILKVINCIEDCRREK